MAVRQTWDEAALRRGSYPAGQLCSALSSLLYSSCSSPPALLQGHFFWDFFSGLAPAREMQLLSSLEREGVLPVPEGSWLIEKSMPLVPKWSILMQTRTPKPHSLNGPKGTVLISQNESADWSVKMLVEIKLHSSSCAGKDSVLLIDIQFQELLCRGWPRQQEQGAGKQCSVGGRILVQASSWSAVFVRDLCVEMGARLLFFFLFLFLFFF